MDLLGVAGGLIGIVSGLTGLAIPALVWLTLLIGGLVLAQLQAYWNAVEKPRRQQEQLGAASFNGAAIDEKAVPAQWTPPTDSKPSVQPALDPHLLRGRVYPYMYAPSIQTAETGASGEDGSGRARPSPA